MHYLHLYIPQGAEKTLKQTRSRYTRLHGSYTGTAHKEGRLKAGSL